MAGFRELLYENFGRDVLDSIANEILAPQISIPALMFHDIADNITPVEDSQAIAKIWKHAKFIETEGLGHRGALQSEAIHKQVVTFMKS
jgi:pimeloyl-ACP methyl ester carboxylesterase